MGLSRVSLCRPWKDGANCRAILFELRCFLQEAALVAADEINGTDDLVCSFSDYS